MTTTPVSAYAPGRAEWLGNHTDYNLGLVLGLGLDVGTTVTGTPRPDRVLGLHAEDLGESCELPLDDLRPSAPGAWSNYSAGVAAGFIGRGAAATGLDLSIRSTLPIGAGLSSSAALECATARVLQAAWGTNFDGFELARIGQEAEHRFAGVRCGLLDQVTSLFSQRDQAVFFDCRSLAVERVPVPAAAAFVIVQTGVKHALSDGAYNDRRAECEAAAAALGLESLRDATPVMIDQAEADGRLAGAPLRRARHITGENARVAEAVEALRRGDLAAVGALMNASHESSRVLFENSCAELDHLAAAARETGGCLGARLTGGGFGGAVLALATDDRVDDFTRVLESRIEADWGRRPAVLVTRAGG